MFYKYTIVMKVMMVSARELFGYSLGAVDGEIGKVTDVYFDDNLWKVRYLVVETGGWLFKRNLLISPDAVVRLTEPEARVIAVNLTREQVEDSPEIDTDLPVSRQQETSLFNHYSWPVSGTAGMGYPTTGMIGKATALDNQQENEQTFDPHLRSFRHVSQYEVHNEEGRIGRADNLIINLENWTVPFLVLGEAPIQEEESVYIPTDKITLIDWSTYQVKTALTAAELKLFIKKD